MKSLGSRLLASALAAVLLWMMLAAAIASNAPVLESDKVIIISTTDVKGEILPCG